MISDQTPVWQLTVGEFKNLIKETTEAKAEQKQNQEPGDYAYGIAGIAEIIGASKTTAQKIKSSGILNGAITQVGNKIITHKKTALELLQKNEIHNRKKANNR